MMMGARPGVTCRDFFKILKLLPLTSQYIYSWALFVSRNMNKFRANSDIHDMNTRNRSYIFQQTVNLAMYQNGPEVSASNLQSLTIRN
jgi:hypothetical protein